MSDASTSFVDAHRLVQEGVPKPLMLFRLLTVAIPIVDCRGWGFSQSSTANPIDEYLRPYVQCGNLAGNVLVQRAGRVVFQKCYGFANREQQVPKTAKTRFHIASLPMQSTAAAVLRLVDTGSIRLDEYVSDFIQGIEGADKITVRDLLAELPVQRVCQG